MLWSNYLQYHNVTLAPRARLSELQKIGTMIAGKGPTFFNEYEIYGDRHFLRAGAPVEPAEYRDVNLPTLGNAFLTDSAWADLDSFALSTLAPYRSLVIRAGPTASLPPSIYGELPVWQGRYYQLWQQPAHPAHRVIEHLPLGDNVNDAYCGSAQRHALLQPPLPDRAGVGAGLLAGARARRDRGRGRRRAARLRAHQPDRRPRDRHAVEQRLVGPRGRPTRCCRSPPARPRDLAR